MVSSFAAGRLVERLTSTFLFQLPHQPTEHDSHDTDENRSQTEGYIDSVVRGHVARLES